MRPMSRFASSKRRSDPAPSRWAWRVERLLLTPAFMLFLRAGVPIVACLAAATWWLSDAARRDALVEAVVEIKTSFETRPEFMVHLMAINGATDALAKDIRTELNLQLPDSSFDLDLEDIKRRVTDLAPVKSASVRIKPGGVLEVEVERRVPVAVWRTRKGLTLVDETGTRIRDLERRTARSDLPLIAGPGADATVAEALQLHRAAAPLGARLRGLVRIGQRRWDVVLDRDQRILLPEDGAVEALERVIALDEAQDILSRDIARVDLRLGARPTVQMSANATEVWWQMRQEAGQ